MNTAAYIDQQIAAWKAEGKSAQWIAWNAGLLCVGWPYVFGAWGAYCTTAERKKRYKSDHPTIYSACQVLREKNKKANCTGCKWLPDGERVRCYDCRGFTDWCLLQAGIDLIGEGATSQWNTAANWSKKGLVSDGIPKDTLVCLFYHKKGSTTVMAHTGLGLNGMTVECSNGVEYHDKMASKWTHWAIPVGIEVGIGEPACYEKPKTEPEPSANRPTIRRGNKNRYVTEMQTILQKLGYDLGICGIDGDFGTATEKALKAFQEDHDGPDGRALNVDGICGTASWWALQQAAEHVPEQVERKYTVTISGLTEQQAEELCRTWSGAKKTEG